jgi:hypothetical protein
MRLIAGMALIGIGLFLVAAGCATPIWGDVDLDTTGKLVLGAIYASIGALVVRGGVLLVRRRR